MDIFDKKSLPRSHYIAGLCVILFVFTVLTVAFWQQNKQTLASRDDALRAQENLNEINILSVKLKSAIVAHHRYILLGTKDSYAEYKNIRTPNKTGTEGALKPNVQLNPIETNFETLEVLLKEDPVQRTRLHSLRRDFDLIWLTLDHIIDLHEKGRKKDALQQLNIYVDRQVAPVAALMGRMLSYETDSLRTKTQKRDKETQQRTTFVLAVISILTIFEVLFYTLMARQRERAQQAERTALARADDVDVANKKLAQANEELFLLNKTIRESGETQIKAIIDNALDAQIMMDSYGIILRYNLAAEKMFGYTSGEMIGKNITGLLLEPYAGECLEHFRLHREAGTCNGTKHKHETAGRRKDDSIFPMDLSMSLFELGGKLHFSWFIRDITARKQSEAKILRYTKELEKSNRDLDDFAYIASHDLKEPLRGLFNHAQFLLEDYQDKLDDDGKRRLDRLSFLSQRMEHLVNDLLYFSRLGRSDLAVQKTDPNQLVFNIQHMLESMIKEKNARIVISAPMPIVVCDRPRITEVFRNLITNGIKYNDKDIKEIEVGFLPSATAPHGFEKDVFYVKDNGMGIDEQYFQEIFRIFRRLHKNEGDDQSTGAGLTFVKKIVERHKGHIWLESTLGQGTTFFFTLGINEEAPKDDKPKESPVAEHPAG